MYTIRSGVAVDWYFSFFTKNCKTFDVRDKTLGGSSHLLFKTKQSKGGELSVNCQQPDKGNKYIVEIRMIREVFTNKQTQ